MNQNLSYTLKLSVLTTVHIGAGSEKYWHDNLDYYYQSGRVYILNQREIASVLSLRELSDWSAKIARSESGFFLGQFFKTHKPAEFSDFSFSISPKPVDDIRTFIRNGYGLPYIPGSSIKGAIRSVIFNSLFNTNNIKNRKIIDRDTKNERLLRPNEYENEVFGYIGNNLMHLLQVSDSYFTKTILRHTKTFNLINHNGDWEEGWKHGNISAHDFNEQGFVFTYECIDYDENADLICSFDKDYLDFLIKKPEFSAQLIPDTKDPLENLFRIINLFARTYIEKEIDFYQKHENDTDDSDSRYMIDCLNWLNEQIDDQNKSCILRLGQGSGFYSITGDWRFNDHVQSITYPDELNKRKNNQTRQFEGTRYKSRKVAFSKENDQYSFDLMGFVKISMIPG
ncbi:MAG: type III-A CRISPR-associated RAMP protein Csm5 [Bacteroidetes bacterium]|nr:type III-A CRISPR-associated RAMP protein Csm5 [Bacteroidota bacterium]